MALFGLLLGIRGSYPRQYINWVPTYPMPVQPLCPNSFFIRTRSSNPMSDALRHEDRFLVFSESSATIRVKGVTAGCLGPCARIDMSMTRVDLVAQALKCFDCRTARRLGSCGNYRAASAVKIRARSVASYVAGRGAVIPRSTPIVRRRSRERSVAPEGINRREEVTLSPFAIRLFASSLSCAPSTPPHIAARTPPPHITAAG